MTRLSQAFSSSVVKDIRPHQARDITIVESENALLRWGKTSSFNFTEPSATETGKIGIDTKEGPTIKENRIISAQLRVGVVDFDLHLITHDNSKGIPSGDLPHDFWIYDTHGHYAIIDSFHMSFTQVLDKPRPGADRRLRRWKYNLTNAARATSGFAENWIEREP